jgi:hypothetical protein
MTIESTSSLSEDPRLTRREAGPSLPRLAQSIGDMKRRQSEKIRELGQTLAAVGIISLDAQANILGLSRSTAWTLLKSNHKGSGLSVATINRMLAAQKLPRLVRDKILEYVEHKAVGYYGHSEAMRRKFVNRLAAEWVNRDHLRGMHGHKSVGRTAA